MKKLLISLILVCSMLVAFSQPSLPFSKGINMLTWFEKPGPDRNIPPDLNKYDENDIACLKSMGVESIRVICTFDLLSDMPYGSGKINDDILEKLDQLCDWAEKYQIYLIICNCYNHVVDSTEHENNVALIKAQLECVWSQLSNRYKNRSDYIIYEITNEPGRIAANKWYKIQQEIINLIRSYDSFCTIVVSGVNWSNITELTQLKPYKDPNLIYTFHFYEPFVFTHQGASWSGPEIADLEGLPFPYDSKRLPKLKGKAKNSWVQDYIQNGYKTEGTDKFINSRIKKAADWAKKNNVRILCGEIGAKVWTNPVDRLAWIKATVSALNDNGISYCTWGIDSTDGFLKTESTTLTFPDDIDKDALEAYGFSMPDGTLAAKCNIGLKEFPASPYLIYDGFAGKGISCYPYGSVKNTEISDFHKNCLSASLPGNNSNGIYFTFKQKFLKEIVKNKDAISIKLSFKFANKTQKFTIVFIDTDEGETALPWQMEYEIKASNYKSGEWVTIEVPFSEFNQEGAWSNKTQKGYPPEGKFDWNRLESLSFYFNDYENAMSGDIYIDDIVIKKK